ncbi:MAG: ATP-binding cassette domain-containing protein [Bacteroidota bacterium]|nr:ATP-binding cassette domain-containing protein [Bacteroidota bacterium]
MSFTSLPVITVDRASIFQENYPVLQDISFTIHKGEFVYLIGKTGSGKSSLLKTLYADLPLNIGQAEVSGVSIKGIKPSKIPYLRRKIGIIFQDFQLLSDRSVNDNLIFVMKATGWKSKSKMMNRLTELLIQVGLGTAGNKLPHQLSGGEQQRVSVARALINEPSVLIADEPTGNLDPEVAEDILKLFIDINRSGTAILMATHNYDFLNKYPARVLRCENGAMINVPLN